MMIGWTLRVDRGVRFLLVGQIAKSLRSWYLWAMGEAKRKRLAACICGTGLTAWQCCWTPNGYFKKPQVIDLHNTGLIGSHVGCYMRATNACDTKLSAEHLISQGVLGVLAKKELEVSGMPWLNGQTKALGFGALTARCLCAKHNSLLSPIDVVGANFFEAIQKCGTTETGLGLNFLLSGHDVERWMLRTLAVFGVSKNFAIDGAVVDQDFVARLQIVELLESTTDWQKPVGIYLLRSPGHQFLRRDGVRLAPIVRSGSDEIMGIILDIEGLEFAF